MEYCSKGSLHDWLSANRKLELDYLVNLFLRLTHTLDFLHRKGFVHHDIKPDNILFTEDKVKISDFGTVNTSIGTIVYSAPEMLIQVAPVDDPRVDIFSLGTTFLECVIGENPLRVGSNSIDEQNLIVKNAEIYLQLNEPSKAATILHGYINNHFNDIEAHNQLLHTYFLSDQWELGLEQAKFLRKLYPKEEVFVNNLNLFELLLGEFPSEIELLYSKNPFGYYNYHDVVANNYPEAYDPTDRKALKLKVLFHDYKFKNIHNSKNTITVEFDGATQHCDEHIISFGRNGYMYNTYCPFDDNQISRRHFVIINQKIMSGFMI